jgi:hypothetical protein
MTVAKNATRGGVMKNDANAVADANLNLPFTKKLVFVAADCLYVNRVFDANTAGFTGLTVNQTMVDRWNSVNKPNCWCCTSQKRGNGVYTGGSATKTDISDLAAVKNAANYGKTIATAANVCLDFNFSGKIDITDLARVKHAANYGKVTGYGPPCQ